MSKIVSPPMPPPKASVLDAPPWTRASRRAALDRLLSDRILVLDGAMGTMLQACAFDESAHRGTRFADHPHDLKGDNDLLSLTQPDTISSIHDAYFEAGADLVETNTFNATRIAQADYGMESEVRAINEAAARIARESADRWTLRTPAQRRFVPPAAPLSSH